MFGNVIHAEINALLNGLSRDHRPLIVSHGGVSVGPIPSNTAMAVRAALHSGTDVVKIDVSASADGVFFAFHDGFESEFLGVERNIQSMSASEIGELTYVWKNRPRHRMPVERLGGLLSQFKGRPVLFALDRSWWRWPALLHMLDSLQMHDQLLLKVPAWEHAALNQLRQHKTKYPAMAICSTLEEVQVLPLHDEAINLVAVELLAIDDEGPWFEREVLDHLRRSRLLTWVNSETLTTGIPLFAGHDDALAVNESPTSAWSRILDMGVDAVQTELPWLLWYLRECRNGTA